MTDNLKYFSIKNLAGMWRGVDRLSSRNISATNYLAESEIPNLTNQSESDIYAKSYDLKSHLIKALGLTTNNNASLPAANNYTDTNKEILQRILPEYNSKLIFLLNGINDNFNYLGIEPDLFLSKINLNNFVGVNSKEKNLNILKLIHTISVDISKSPYVSNDNIPTIENILDSITSNKICSKNIDSSNQHPLLTIHDALFVKADITEVKNFAGWLATSDKTNSSDLEKLYSLQAAKQRQDSAQVRVELKTGIVNFLQNSISLDSLATTPLVTAVACYFGGGVMAGLTAAGGSLILFAAKNYVFGNNSGLSGWAKRGFYGKTESDTIKLDKTYEDKAYFQHCSVAPELIVSLATRPNNYWSNDVLETNCKYLGQIINDGNKRTSSDLKKDTEIYRIKNPALKAIHIDNNLNGKSLDCLYNLDNMCAIYGYNPNSKSYNNVEVKILEQRALKSGLRDIDIKLLHEFSKIFPDDNAQNIINKLNSEDDFTEMACKTLSSFIEKPTTPFIEHLNSTIKNHLDVVALKDRNMISPLLGWNQYGGNVKNKNEFETKFNKILSDIYSSNVGIKEVTNDVLLKDTPKELVKSKMFNILEQMRDNRNINSNKNTI